MKLGMAGLTHRDEITQSLTEDAPVGEVMYMNGLATAAPALATITQEYCSTLAIPGW